MLPATVGHGGHAALVHEERKRMHQPTEAQCQAQELQFLPLVAEGCAGGWGPTGMTVFRQLGSFLAAHAGESSSKLTEEHHLATGERASGGALPPRQSCFFTALSEPWALWSSSLPARPHLSRGMRINSHRQSAPFCFTMTLFPLGPFPHLVQ